MNEWLPEINSWRDAGENVVIATVAKVQGSAPRPVGARLAVNASGDMAGSVSGGCVESAVVISAMDVQESGVGKLEHFGISDEMAWDVGLSCGGVIDVWIEPMHAGLDEALARQKAGEDVTLVTWLDGSGKHLVTSERIADENGMVDWNGSQVLIERFPPVRQLVIFGAVHTAQPLSRYAQDLGFDVVVVDARTALATSERFPNVERIITAWPEQAYEQLEINASTWIAILSHDPKFDEPAITGALATDAAYIGTVGSRKTNADRRERLLASGVSEEQLSRLHGPIGLDIGGRTPEAMAISILAEMIAIENGRDGGMLKSTSGSIVGKAL